MAQSDSSLGELILDWPLSSFRNCTSVPENVVQVPCKLRDFYGLLLLCGYVPFRFKLSIMLVALFPQGRFLKPAKCISRDRNKISKAGTPFDRTDEIWTHSLNGVCHDILEGQTLFLLNSLQDFYGKLGLRLESKLLRESAVLSLIFVAFLEPLLWHEEFRIKQWNESLHGTNFGAFDLQGHGFNGLPFNMTELADNVAV